MEAERLENQVLYVALLRNLKDPPHSRSLHGIKDNPSMNSPDHILLGQVKQIIGIGDQAANKG